MWTGGLNSYLDTITILGVAIFRLGHKLEFWCV